MRTTLFFIPAELFGVPTFGLGWLLGAWIVIGVLAALWMLRRPGGSREVANSLLVFAVVGVVIAFGLPNLVEAGPDGKPLGLPVRGYGVMLMLATICAVGLAAYRAQQVGLHPDTIYSLAFVMFIAGIFGARMFYVLQYWDREFSPSVTGNLANTLKAILNVPKGGLVVYGSVLGGVPAGLWYCLKRGLPPLAIGDIIAPSMLVGLALGRIGCFLNGCCYGGVCLTAPIAVTFPAGSPPYVHHETGGWDTGVWLQAGKTNQSHIAVGHVAPNSPAEQAGLRPGAEVTSVNGTAVDSLARARQVLAQARGAVELETADGKIFRWTMPAPPPRSVPVHPTQLYAAIDGGLLALVLWLYFPFRTRDGQVFALMLVTHPISRFLLEWIRDDELGFRGTSLTVSQWISAGFFLAGIVLWIYLRQQPSSFGSAPQAKATN